MRRRIELIQDFDMPDISHTVNVTPDGRYVFASGLEVISTTYNRFIQVLTGLR